METGEFDGLDMVAVEEQLTLNQENIDYAEALLARGGADADGVRERLAVLEAERCALLDQRDRLAGTARRAAIDTAEAAEAGPVMEDCAQLLFRALWAHASSVEQQLRLLDEKDVGYRGDAHIRAILRLLDSALG